jgi:hypothetical protein
MLQHNDRRRVPKDDHSDQYLPEQQTWGDGPHFEPAVVQALLGLQLQPSFTLFSSCERRINARAMLSFLG